MRSHFVNLKESPPIFFNLKKNQTHLNLFERYFERKGLVEVWIQCAFLDTGLFLLQPFAILK